MQTNILFKKKLTALIPKYYYIFFILYLNQIEYYIVVESF